MPISQVDIGRVEDLTPFLNQRLRCQVMEVDRAEKNLVVSRRVLLAKEQREAKERLFETLTEGKTIRGTVKTIMPYGAFVDIGGADGLLHVKDMSFSRVEDPRQIVKEGQSLELMVLKVDRAERRIALGLKQVMPDPWADVASKYIPDTIVTGRVTRLAEFGAFVELEPGVEALAPISELSFERRLKHPSEVVKETSFSAASSAWTWNASG
jgi:small subunit ribosomal protein S1